MLDMSEYRLRSPLDSDEPISLTSPSNAQALPQPKMQTPTSVPSQQPYVQPLPPFVQYWVTETHDFEDSSVIEKKRITFDPTCEHMILEVTKDKVKFKHTESPDVNFGIHVNNRHSKKITRDENFISTGCVNLIRVFSQTDENGAVGSPQCDVEIIYRQPIGKLTLPVDAIRRKDKAVRDALAGASVTFESGGFNIWCTIFADFISKVPVKTRVSTGTRTAIGSTSVQERWC